MAASAVKSAMKMARALATEMAEISQKRTTTVVSGQPMSSKWWWIGDIRNSLFLRPLALNTPIWMATEPASITLMAQISGSRRWVLSVRARKASAAPTPSAPTSPMKIRAGAAFHHRKPRQPPAKPAASTPRSSGLITAPYTSGLRNAQ